MLKELVSAAALAGAAMATRISEKEVFPTPRYEFKHFLADFGGEYEAEEYAMREEIFLRNRMHILQQNTAHALGKSTWKASMNRYGDRTDEEMQTLRGHKTSMGRRVRDDSENKRVHRRSVADLPVSVDWRTNVNPSVLTPVKNQANCGSCWAFGTTETLEAHVALATGQDPPVLSPQQYVNCVQNTYKCGGSGGCGGATAEVAFNYTAVHGLPLEADVPYTAKDGVCDPTVRAAARVTGYHELKMNDADELMQAVANVGPVSISVAAAKWSFYSSGIFDGFLHQNDYDVDHAVQLVGYGVENDVSYWIVRNSWGPDWGEEGFIRLLRNPGNEPCGVDPTPMDGVCGTGPCACADPLTYCGTSGVLSDSVYPIGAQAV